ncbi:putative RNA binding protein YcfA (HicA-like mRNA interferase family) [Saccharomonospora amisosensis]|uniref:Putative RNA binding protein YcfA (HicA-like mRNA interferase family) n=1 Tax=Saccharomonospora amisosensis TaxID=1128677 RepID=A0A7X5UMB2_9PSEU|nr:putative RNA binding protein YcfA (HicA-like mRNA interferase family) [Saccharomonospora amisosensis]
MSRPRHPDPELEKLLKSLERQGWRVWRGKGYYKAYCSCPDRHKKTIRITPNKSYNLNVRMQLKRRTCWQEER